jgi:hypothetical protein
MKPNERPLKPVETSQVRAVEQLPVEVWEPWFQLV